MIDLLSIQPAEAERLAYAEGFGMAAQLFARIVDLQRRVDEMECALEAIADGGRFGTMTAAQCAGAAREVLPC